MRWTKSILCAVTATLLACGESTSPEGGGGGNNAGGNSGGGGQSITDVEQLLTEAPLVHEISGTEAASGRLTYIVPGGWAHDVFEGAVRLQAPTSNGVPCEIWILDPRPATASREAQWEQLLSSVQSLYPEGTQFKAEFLDNPYADAKYGRSPSGFEFVGLRLTAINAAAVNAYLAVFGSEAVPVIENQPFGATCDIIGPSTEGIDSALVFHSLWLDAFEANTTGLLPDLIGKWTLLTSSAGALTIFAANNQYLIAIGTSQVVVQNGDLYDVTSTWAGDGAWVNIGPFLGYLGARSRSTNLARIHEETNSLSPTGWISVLCETGSGPDGVPYEVCKRRSFD
ncbi:MAG: hypothetical protein HC923_01010 [Myxococcales bacterium]|nr:hypothetical protein [Myxococcales bacterium]